MVWMREHVWLLIIIFSPLTRLIEGACNGSCWTEAREEYEWIKRCMWESEVILDPQSHTKQNPHTFIPFISLSHTHKHSSSHCLKFPIPNLAAIKPPNPLSWDAPRYATCWLGAFARFHTLFPALLSLRIAGSIPNPYLILLLLRPNCMCSSFDPTFNSFKAFFVAFVFAWLTLSSDMLLRFSFSILGDCRGKIHGCSPWMFGRFLWSD